MDFPIIFEDEYFCIIDKPSGLVVNEAHSVKTVTIQQWAEKKLQIKIEHIKSDAHDFYKRAGIVHRLDKDTSGLLIIAKSPQSFIELQQLFKDKKIVKNYKALSHGKIVPQKADIHASVGRLPWNRERFGVLAGGREAHTSYRVINYYTDGKSIYTFLQLIPTTGRTHQLRIHLKYIGHPIVADEFYAGRKIYRGDITFCPRLFLHANYLQFIHPQKESEIVVESEMPEELRTVLNSLTVVD